MNFGMVKNYIKYFSVIGLGFNIFLSKNKILFRLGASHYSVLNLSPKILIEKTQKNKFKISSFDFLEISFFSVKLKYMKFPEVYTSKGIWFDLENITKKQGKTVTF
jgi:ribosomal protein L6P/L9E